MNHARELSYRYVLTKFPAAVLIATLGIFYAPEITAATFFSNLGQSDNGGSRLDNTSYHLATDFFTGTSAATIRSATLFMGNPDNIGHNYTLSIFTDRGGGTPGTLVGSFDTAFIAAFSFTPPYVMGNHSFSTPGITLAPNTAYWAVLQMDESIVNSDSYWGWTSSQVAELGVFSTIAATPLLVSMNGGANWNAAGNDNFKFSLSDTVVPEPAIFPLLSVGLLYFYLRVRKTRCDLRSTERS